MTSRATLPAPRRIDLPGTLSTMGVSLGLNRRIVLVRLNFVLLLLLTLPAAAASSAPTFAPGDWRQLWEPGSLQSWQRKSESELKKLAAENHPAAQYMLWRKWSEVKKSEARAMFELALKAGFPQAVYWRGSGMFTSATEPLANRLEGWAMMERAAARGYPTAQAELAQYEAGFLTTSGYKVKPNLNRALEYFRSAVQAGDPGSMMHLALLYSSGIGEPRSDKESPHNLLIAAVGQGKTEAMIHLGERYALGHGEQADPLEAARWFFLARQDGSSLASFVDLADEEGNARAQNTLQRQEVASAYSLFVRAVKRQDAGAATTLAKRYQEQGRAGEAAVLLTFAKRLGAAEAGAEAAKIEAALSPDQKRSAATLFPFIK